jgi:hypothetical protein
MSAATYFQFISNILSWSMSASTVTTQSLVSLLHVGESFVGLQQKLRVVCLVGSGEVHSAQPVCKMEMECILDSERLVRMKRSE